MTNNIIFKSIHGSQLYGTNSANSDTDYKGVFVEPIESIILGRDAKHINVTTNKGSGRNTVEDIDTELKELRTFIRDCLSGQTYALELLFTPKQLWVESSTTWLTIVENRDKLITKNLMPFIGYCRSQSLRYSCRGNRLTALEEVVKTLEEQDRNVLLSQVVDKVQLNDYVTIGEHELNSGFMDKYLDVLGIKLQLTKPIKELLPSLYKRLNNYGERSKKTQQEAFDTKAYSHAFRVLYQLEELLTTSAISFPVMNCDYIRKVKFGEVGLEEMQDFLYSEMERVLALPNNLPEPNYAFWDSFILKNYLLV